MSLNFPANPSNGDIYTSGSVTYVYQDPPGKWTASTSSSSGGAVQRAGDNMTGDLTLGTDRITLDATDGNATFAGDVEAGVFFHNQPSGNPLLSAFIAQLDGQDKFRVRADGEITISDANLGNPGGIRVLVEPNGHLALGNDATVNPAIDLKADGSATFAGGLIDFNGVFGSAEFADGDFRIDAQGSILVGATSFTLTDSKAYISGIDGNATFAGGDINLTADGDINFTPPAGVGGIQSRLIWTTEAPFLDEVASIEASRAGDTNAATSLTFNTGGGTAGSLKQALSLNADGTAAFAGDITITNTGDKNEALTIYRNGTNRVRIDKFGALFLGDGAGSLLSAANAKIAFSSSDGSATFANNVSSTNSATEFSNLIASGGLSLGNAATYATPVITLDSPTYGRSFLLNSDGSATFAGNITAANVSDIKFKENIADAKPQLDDAVALGSSLKNWDWKEEAPLNDELKARRFLGLIAQEAEEVCPGITYEVGEGEDSYKAINHDILVMKLLGAVAELKAELDELKNQ